MVSSRNIGSMDSRSMHGNDTERLPAASVEQYCLQKVAVRSYDFFIFFYLDKCVVGASLE